MQATFLTFVARGLAGLVADKAWGAGLGERNSGKSVLCGLLELAFGRQLVKTMNSESFLQRQSDVDNQQSDSYTYLSSVTRYLPKLERLASFARILKACHLLRLETYPPM